MTERLADDGEGRGPGDGSAAAALVAGFAAARAAAPVPGVALMDRILADADAVQRLAALPPRPAKAAVRPSRRRFAALADLSALLGGWPALSGMATAAAAGVWIGLGADAAGLGLAALGGADDAAAGAAVVELLPGPDSFALTDALGGEL